MAKTIIYLEFKKGVSVNTSISITIKMGGTGDTFCYEKAVSQRTKKREFEVSPTHTPAQSASSFANAWNRDFRDVGGVGNMTASIATVNGNSGVRITVDDEDWEVKDLILFQSTPNEMGFSYTNSTGKEVREFDHSVMTGDCNNVTYSISIKGGTRPFTISGLPDGNIQAPPNGNFTLRRGSPANVRVTDSLGNLIQEKAIVPPKKLNPSDFQVRVETIGNSVTATASPTVRLNSGEQPITYSVDGTNFTVTGKFPDLDFENTYILRIRDKFGCTVTRNFITPKYTGAELEQNAYRVAMISNAGTLIFSERQELSPMLRKNPLNSGSCGEYNALPYGYIHDFMVNDIIKQQFKSSYDYNKVSLITNGRVKTITALLQAQNLNLLEKVEAKMFTTPTRTVGLYFEGGAKLVPNTETFAGQSYYGTDTLGQSDFPSWGKAGQKVELDIFGKFTVQRVSTDPERGIYLDLGGSRTSGPDVEVRVQAAYNRQDYNTYEFVFPMISVEGSGRIIIEMGFDGLVERTFVSELIRNVDEDPRRSLIKWGDPLNKAGIVHQTGIEHFARMYLKMNHKTVSTSELYGGDSDTYNLNQEAYTIADFETAVTGFKMENKLALASGMENFSINQVRYKKESMDSDIQGDSNIRVIKAVLRMGGNDLTRNDEEIVLDPPSTPISEEPIALAESPEALAYDSGGLVLNGSGGFVVV